MGNGGIQLRIGDLLFAVQKRWKIIVMLTLLGGMFGLLLSGMSYVQSSLTSYSISGSVSINTLSPDGKYLYGDDAPSQNDYHLAEDMVDSVIYIMRSDRVLEEVINREELLGISYEDIRNGMSISSYSSTQILEMTINWANDEEGKEIWHAIIDVANEIMPETLLIGHLAIINDCKATLLGVGGTGRTFPILLAILGFAAGVGFAVMELLMHPTLTNVKDIETVFGLETIGLIPHDDAYFKKTGSILVREETGSSAVAQNYAAAAFILRNRLGTKGGHHCFYVTSATEHEGRSSVAANLAIQLSDMEHHTLLVDFDLKNPSLGALFMNNVDYEHSLNALYRGEINEKEAITTLTGYLDILPAVLERNTVLLDSIVMDLIRSLSERYEYVILDAPPVGKESETLSLNQLAETVLFVVSYDSASIPEIQGALDKLDKSGIRVLGCIVNNVQGTRYQGQKDKNVKKEIREAQKKQKSSEKPFAGDGQDDKNDPLIVGGKARKKKEKGKKEDSSKARKKGKKDAPDTSAPEAPAEATAHTPRNVIDELLAETPSSKGMNDEDVLAEMYKIGIQGDEKEDPETQEASGEEGVVPASDAQEQTTQEVHEAEPQETLNAAHEEAKVEVAEDETAKETNDPFVIETAEKTPKDEPWTSLVAAIEELKARAAEHETVTEETSEAEPQDAPEETVEEPEVEVAEDETVTKETSGVKQQEISEKPETGAAKNGTAEETGEAFEVRIPEESPEYEPWEITDANGEELELGPAEVDTAEGSPNDVPWETFEVVNEEPEAEAAQDETVAEESSEPEPQDVPEETVEEPEAEAEAEETVAEETFEAESQDAPEETVEEPEAEAEEDETAAEETSEPEPQDAPEETVEEPEAEAVQDETVAEETSEAESQDAPEETVEEPVVEAEEDETVAEETSEMESQDAPEETVEEPEVEAVQDETVVEETSEAEFQDAPEETIEEQEAEAEEDETVADETSELEPQDAPEETVEEPETEAAEDENVAEETSEAESQDAPEETVEEPEVETVADETSEPEPQDAPEETVEEPEAEATEDETVAEETVAEETSEVESQDAPEENIEEPEVETVAEEISEAEPQDAPEETVEEPEAEAAEDETVAEETFETESQDVPEETVEEPEAEAAEDETVAEETSEMESQDAPEETVEEPEAEAAEDETNEAPAVETAKVTPKAEPAQMTVPDLPEQSIRQSEKAASGRLSRRLARELNVEDEEDAEDIQEVSSKDVWNTDGWGNP